MALLFPRIANNFANSGYFPTDEKTLECILSFLEVAPSVSEGYVPLLDPCCGEGVALAEMMHHLRRKQTAINNRVVSYGIELDTERYAHARLNMLDHCILSDIDYCTIQPRAYSLLFLNPPYGRPVFRETDPTRNLLEKRFYAATYSSLAWGGVLVLIIPHTSLDQQMTKWLSSHYEEVRVYRAATDKYRQVVVFGIRCPARVNEKRRKQLLAMAEKPENIPLISTKGMERYCVPVLSALPKQFMTNKPGFPQVCDAVYGSAESDWRSLLMRFNALHTANHSRPLQPVGNWHRCLLLAAGVVNGWLESKGYRVLVKGAVEKVETHNAKELHNSEGDFRGMRHTRRVDHQALVYAINMTEEHRQYGKIFQIR